MADFLVSRVRCFPGSGQILFNGLGFRGAAYIIGQATRLGVSKTVLARMLANIVLDSLLGSIPLIGDLFDVGFKANRKNVDLLRRNLSKAEHEPGKPA